jgi:uncharacterized protein YtpQ (UPF0354 family)
MSFFKKIFNTGNDTTPNQTPTESFENISTKIFPYFKQFLPPAAVTYSLPGDIRKIDKTKTYDLPPEANIVFSNISEDLNCLYAIDTGNSFHIIQERHLREWDITKEQLHALALENFRSLIVQKMTAKGDTNGIILIVDGNLEAGLVLIDEIWVQLQDQIGEAVVITVPSRDVLMATGKSNRTMINKFKENSKQILLTGDHPLSKNLFIRENGNWRFFEKILP